MTYVLDKVHNGQNNNLGDFHTIKDSLISFSFFTIPKRLG